MTDNAGEPVTIQATNPRDGFGVRLTNLNASGDVEIWNEDRSSVILPSTLMVWRAANLFDPPLTEESGRFTYVWDSTGQTAGKFYAKVTITPTGGVGSFEWKLIELADENVLGSCGDPWVDPGDVPGLTNLDEELRELIVVAASRLLWAASGRQFSGVCTDKIRPLQPNCGVGFPFGSYLNRMSDWPSQEAMVTFPFPFSSRVELPGYPIVDVVKILIDGIELPKTTDGRRNWWIENDRYLIRADGLSWPSWQRPDRADTELHTWSVEYTWGYEVPPGGILACRVLVDELLKAHDDDQSCRLPATITQQVREGVTDMILDPSQFLTADGKFGVWEIDKWIDSVNPAHLREDAKVINVDLLDQAIRLR